MAGPHLLVRLLPVHGRGHGLAGAACGLDLLTAAAAASAKKLLARDKGWILNQAPMATVWLKQLIGQRCRAAAAVQSQQVVLVWLPASFASAAVTKVQFK
jgi:hypothetical protein